MPDRPGAREIAGELRAAISDGTYAAGERLPVRRVLEAQYGVSSQTITAAINLLRAEGLVETLVGSGAYVRPHPPVMRVGRRRLSQAERDAGRGAALTDAYFGGWTLRAATVVEVRRADERVASALEVDLGSEVLVRDRVHYRDEQPYQLATSYLPRDVTEGTPIEDENPGPGGIHQRLIDAGHHLDRFVESVRIGQASEHEAHQLRIPLGAPIYRIERTAHTEVRPVEVNYITIIADHVQLIYELPAT